MFQVLLFLILSANDVVWKFPWIIVPDDSSATSDIVNSFPGINDLICIIPFNISALFVESLYVVVVLNVSFL